MRVETNRARRYAQASIFSVGRCTHQTGPRLGQLNSLGLEKRHVLAINAMAFALVGKG